MKISINAASVQNWSGEALIVGIVEDQLDLSIKVLEERFGKAAEDHLRKNKFTGKINELLTVDLLDSKPQKIICIGLGNS